MENNHNKIGVAQKAIILNKDGKLLALRRTETAPSGPLRWDLPGGNLDFGEDPTKGIIREVKEETGLDIKNPAPFDVEAHINPLGDFWVTIAYKVNCASESVKLSYEHDDHRWVTPAEFLKLESGEKFRRFVKKLISD